jgi:signal transduction histidine kinase
VASKTEVEKLIVLLNEKEVQLKDREIALDEQQEEFMAQKEELTAAVEELIAKNSYLTSTLASLRLRNEQLDQILYRASHDLKTPVSSILGLISVMHTTGINEDQQTILAHLLDKTRQMEFLLTSLSDLSIAFFQKLNAERCSIDALVQAAWRKQRGSGDLQFDCRFKDVWFSTDKTLLYIVLTSLLKNAIDYSYPYVNNEIAVNAFTSASGLTIEISNAGEAIPTELSDKIFEMFFRGSHYSTGPGLGLYISKLIVERLQGEIKLVNDGDRKSFVVTLPEMML